MDKLQEIIAHKRTEIAPLLPRAEEFRRAAAARDDFRSLYAALAPGEESLAVIAEVKRASPSAGVIAADFDPVAVAKRYDEAGAAAISVLTDEKFFQGSLEYLVRVRAEVGCPVLRKDFIVHEAQIWEAAAAGADAILLIVAALGQDELVRLLDTATACGLDSLVEVHDLAELDRALETDARIIGINNRNLKTFAVDLATTQALTEEVGDGIALISESGIKTAEDAAKVFNWGADAILVGESLMRAPDPGALLGEFRQVKRTPSYTVPVPLG
ncbi:MAG: indole-3-glycerol phosphate synthase TrpC [Verrucomicrobiales bacterium]